MTQPEYRIVERSIRKLRYRVQEELAAVKHVDARFASAHLECLLELLSKFETRLNSERISVEVDFGSSSTDLIKSHQNKTETNK